MPLSKTIQPLRFYGGQSGSFKRFKTKSSITKCYVPIGRSGRQRCLPFSGILLHQNRVCSSVRSLIPFLHVTTLPESVPSSIPRAVCREAALSILQNSASSLVDHTTLSKASFLSVSSHVVDADDHSAGRHLDVTSSA